MARYRLLWSAMWPGGMAGAGGNTREWNTEHLMIMITIVVKFGLYERCKSNGKDVTNIYAYKVASIV